MTFVGGSTLTAAQLNTYLLDNLKETEAAKASTLGRIFATTGANAVVEREFSAATVSTSQTTTATSYADLATVGPAVTVTTGTQAIVGMAGRLFNNQTSAFESMSFAVSGATTIGAQDSTAIVCHSGGTANSQSRVSVIRYLAGLTAGSNTFTCKYKVSLGTATFNDRHIWVLAL
jgi:hypothetical protein